MTATPSPTLASLLRRHRAASGLTQEELAERAGMSARTISDIERGLRHRVYRYTAGCLAEALGLAPPERKVFEAAARGGPASAPQAGAPGGARTAGPLAAPTPIIGRQREIALVLATLGTPGARLTTITGTGGIGKTRLAVEVAALAGELFEDGVTVASLGVTSDAQLLPSMLASATGAAERGGSAYASLRDHLRSRHLLLVLDTFEHVLAAAPLVGELLADCPRLSVLATSRAPLRLRGEREVPLPPLDLPAVDGDPAASPAVALFADRARSVRPSFALDADTAPVAARVCRRLGGLPLAIELAAARLRHLPLPVLEANLDDSLALLTGGALDLAPRHQTMRDTIAWSYDLLDAAERSLLARLCVFAGGWSLAAAAAICVDRGEGAHILTSLSALVDQSLIRLSDPVGTEARYDMLDLIREYAAEQLASAGEVDAFRRLHARHFLAMAEELAPGLETGAQDDAFRRLEADRDNLRAALAWFVDDGAAAMALRLTGALWQFWRRRGDFTEARLGLDTALAMEGPSAPAVRATALWGAAWLAYHQGDHARTRRLGDELLHEARVSGGPLEVRNGLTILGMAALAEATHQEAVALFAESLELARSAEPSWHHATSLMNLGVALLHAGELDLAEQRLGEARALHQTVGDRVFSARTEVHLAQVALRRGDTALAGSLLRSALGAFREAGEAMGMAETLDGLSAVHAGEGALDRAARLAGAAAALRAARGIRPHPFDQRLNERLLDAAGADRQGDTWRTGVEAGGAMGLEEACAEA